MGGGDLNTLIIGSEKRGKFFNSLTFQVLSFCKVRALLVLVLYFKGNEMELKGTFH